MPPFISIIVLWNFILYFVWSCFFSPRRPFCLTALESLLTLTLTLSQLIKSPRMNLLHVWVEKHFGRPGPTRESPLTLWLIPGAHRTPLEHQNQSAPGFNSSARKMKRVSWILGKNSSTTTTVSWTGGEKNTVVDYTLRTCVGVEPLNI